MARVVFTSHLQRHVACPETNVPAGTLKTALDRVFALHPRVKDYVLDEQGELRKHVVVFIDGRRLSDRRHLSDPVGNESEVYVLQALTGG
jgi:molybdopterin synthase sulfur carrier subunit